jgi:hypothetical protein
MQSRRPNCGASGRRGDFYLAKYTYSNQRHSDADRKHDATEHGLTIAKKELDALRHQ